MKTSLKGILAILSHEGLVTSSYKDSAGVWTIGVGHTAAAGGLVPKPGLRIGVDEAIELFAVDLAKFEKRVAQAIRRPLKQHEFDALVSFDFNTGAIIKGTVDDLINAGRFKEAMAKLQQYDKAGGKKLKGLDRRRDEEEAMFLGRYPEVRSLAVYDAYPGHPRLVPVSSIDLSALAVAAAPEPETRPATTSGAAGGAIFAGGGAAAVAVEQGVPWPVIVAGVALIAAIAFIIWKRRKS